MIGLLLAAAMVPLAWEGRATVYAGGRTIEIAVRSRMERDGLIVSESWPVAEGESKGLRRLIIRPDGTGTLTRSGATTPLEPNFVRQEQAQFAFYQQYQAAAGTCGAQRQVSAFEMSEGRFGPLPGAARTAFRCGRRFPTNAANWVAAPGNSVRQDFRMIGQWRNAGNSFPKRLMIRRDGALFFDLRVTRFRVP